MDHLKDAVKARQEPDWKAPGLKPEKQLFVALLRRLFGDAFIDDEKMIAGHPVGVPLTPEDLRGE